MRIVQDPLWVMWFHWQSDSMKIRRLEAVLLRDCFLDCRRIPQWHEHRPVIQVCQQKWFVLKNEAVPHAHLQITNYSTPMSNPRTVWVCEQPDSMNNWRLETRSSQDCSPKLSGTQKMIKPNAPRSNPRAAWVFEQPDFIWRASDQNNAIARLFLSVFRNSQVDMSSVLSPKSNKNDSY